MSGSTDARHSLFKALQDPYRHVHTAGAEFARAYTASAASGDLVDLMGQAASLVLALAQLQEQAKRAEADVRSALLLSMMETGCPSIGTATVTAYLAKRAPHVDIADLSAIPAEYMRQPPPAPDKAAIKAAIEAGTSVAGAGMVYPNDFTLAIRAKR